MTKSKFRLNLDFLIICLIGLHVFFWFEKDLLYIGGDSGIPLNPIKNLQHLLTWRVQQGGTESWNLTTCFQYLFFALFEFLGCGLAGTQRLYIYFTYTLAGLSMYYLATTFAEYKKRMVGLVAGLFYMFNPFLLGLIHVYAYLPYAVMPLVVGLFCRGLTNRMGKIKSTLFIFLALFGIIGDIPNYKNYAIAALLMFLCSIYYLIAGEVRARHIVKYIVTLGLILVLFSLWFILPFGSFLSYTSIGEKLGQHGVDFGDYGYATIANLFRLLGSASFHGGGATYGKAYMDNPLLILIGYSIPVLAFLSIVLNPRSKSVLLFSIISFVFISLAKGTNPPFGEVYKWVVLHVPLARAFRTSWSLSLGASIGYAFLIGTTTASLFDRLKFARPYLARLLIGAIVLLILTYSWPLVKGTYLETIYNPPDYKGVKIPDSYYEMERFISSDKGDFRILKMPLSGGYITTNWGYSGSNIVPYIFSKPFIDSYILPNSSSKICKLLFDLIEKEDFVHLDKFLRLLNIKYILIDGYDKTSIYNRNLARYIHRFSSQANLRLVKRIDRLYLFENTSRLAHIYPVDSPVIVKGSLDSLIPLVTDIYMNDDSGFLFMEQGKGSENYPVDKAKEIIFCNQQMIDLICDLIEPKYHVMPHSPSFSVQENNMYSIWLDNTGASVKRAIEDITIDGENVTDKLTARIDSQEDVYSLSGEKWQYLGDTFLPGGEHRLAFVGKKEYGIDGHLLIIPKDEFMIQADKINGKINSPELKTTYLFSKNNLSDTQDKESIINSPVHLSGASGNKLRARLSPMIVNKENYFYKDNLGSETELQKWSINRGTMGLEPVIASIDKGSLILLNLNKKEITINLDARAGSGQGGSGDIKAWLNGSLIDKDKISAYLPEVVFKGLPLLSGKNIVTTGDIPISNDFQFEMVPGVVPQERLTTYDSRYSYSSSEEKGLVISTDYNSGAGMEELTTLLRKIGPVKLAEFQFLSMTASVDEPSVQGIEIIGGVDYSGDGVIDGFINIPLDPPLARHGVFKLNLYEMAQQRFPYRSSYNLCELGFILHKRWGKDCSGNKGGNYRFYFKDVSLYSEKTVMLCGWDSNSEVMVPEIESKNIDYNPLFLDDGRLVINTYFAGNKPFRGKVSEDGEGEKTRVFVLQSGDKLTGDIVEEDTSMIKLKGAKELDNTPVEIWKDKVSYEYKLDEDMDLMSKIIRQDTIDNNTLLNNRYVKTTYLSEKVNLDEYPYLKVVYKVDDPSSQGVECELGLDITNDGVEDMAIPVRRSLPLNNWWGLGSSRTMDFYRTKLPDEFSQDYTIYNLSGNEYVVYRNGEPVKNRLKDWEDGKVMVDAGGLRPGEVVTSLLKGESPDKDEWTMNYLPLPVPSKQFPGYMEINANIKDIAEREQPRRNVGTVHAAKGLVRLSLYLKHRLFSQSEPRDNYNFDIKGFAFYKISTAALQDILKDKGVLSTLPLFRVDGKRFAFKDMTGVSLNAPESDLLIETDAFELDKGNHTISPLINNTFDIKEMVIEPYSKMSDSNGARLPVLNVKKINPTRYIIKSDIGSPFLLVFGDSFHKLWRAYCKVLPDEQKSASRDKNRSIKLTQHYIVNGYANGWWVDTAELKSLNPDAKSFEIILEYEPQKLFKTGLMISLVTLMLCIAYLIGRVIGRTGVTPVIKKG